MAKLYSIKKHFELVAYRQFLKKQDKILLTEDK